MKENEIKFMLYMEQHILPNRKNVGYDTIREAASFVGIPISGGNCRTCIQKGGMDLLNLYGRLKNSWLEYKKEQEKMKVNEIPLTSKYEYEEVKYEEKIQAELEETKIKEVIEKYEPDEIIVKEFVFDDMKETEIKKPRKRK